jgi:hypothetical protein
MYVRKEDGVIVEIPKDTLRNKRPIIVKLSEDYATGYKLATILGALIIVGLAGYGGHYLWKHHYKDSKK